MFNLILGTSDASLGDTIVNLVVFMLLVWAVGHFAFKPVSKVMEDRANKINNDLDSAAQSREDAANLAASRATELKNSKAEALQIVNTAKQSGEQKRQDMLVSAQQEVQTLKEKANQDIQQSKQDALASARDDVAQLSVDIASKLLKKELSVDDQKSLIDSYIEGLDQVNETR